jgi:hypothetical protein
MDKADGVQEGWKGEAMGVGKAAAADVSRAVSAVQTGTLTSGPDPVGIYPKFQKPAKIYKFKIDPFPTPNFFKLWRRLH